MMKEVYGQVVEVNRVAVKEQIARLERDGIVFAERRFDADTRANVVDFVMEVLALLESGQRVGYREFYVGAFFCIHVPRRQLHERFCRRQASQKHTRSLGACETRLPPRIVIDTCGRKPEQP